MENRTVKFERIAVSDCDVDWFCTWGTVGDDDKETVVSFRGVSIINGFAGIVRDTSPRCANYSFTVGIKLKFKRFTFATISFRKVKKGLRIGWDTGRITVGNMADDKEILGESVTGCFDFDFRDRMPGIELGSNSLSSGGRVRVVLECEEELAGGGSDRNCDGGDSFSAVEGGG